MVMLKYICFCEFGLVGKLIYGWIEEINWLCVYYIGLEKEIFSFI